MIAGARRQWKWPLGWLTRCIIMIFLGGLTAAGQQADQLEEQLQQLKQQYDATTHDLEQRIAALEQQVEKEKEATEKTKEATVSVSELAEQAARKAVFGEKDQVGAKYQGRLPSEPTYDLLTRQTKKSQS